MSIFNKIVTISIIGICCQYNTSIASQKINAHYGTYSTNTVNTNSVNSDIYNDRRNTNFQNNKETKVQKFNKKIENFYKSTEKEYKKNIYISERLNKSNDNFIFNNFSDINHNFCPQNNLRDNNIQSNINSLQENLLDINNNMKNYSDLNNNEQNRNSIFINEINEKCNKVKNCKDKVKSDIDSCSDISDILKDITSYCNFLNIVNNYSIETYTSNNNIEMTDNKNELKKSSYKLIRNLNNFYKFINKFNYVKKNYSAELNKLQNNINECNILLKFL